jgi:hypothetical protein
MEFAFLGEVPRRNRDGLADLGEWDFGTFPSLQDNGPKKAKARHQGEGSQKLRSPRTQRTDYNRLEIRLRNTEGDSP